MATDSASKSMNRILTSPRPRAELMSPEEAHELSAGHDQFIREEITNELRRYHDNYLSPLHEQAQVLRKDGISDPLVYNARAIRPPRTVAISSSQSITGEIFSSCKVLSVSEFLTETPEHSTPVPDGITTFARSSANERTLEVGASTGHYPPFSPVARLFPGSQQLGQLGTYNEALATLGAVLDLPARTFGILDVKIEVGLEFISGTSVTTFPSNYIFTMGGDSNLAVNGGTAAWIDLILTLHAGDESVSASKKLLGGWGVVSDTGNPTTVIEDPNGDSFTISTAIGLGAFGLPQQTRRIFIAVDAHAVAFAQGMNNNGGQGFAQIELRDKNLTPANMDMGIYTPLIKIRVQNVTAMLCPPLVDPQ